MSYFEKLKEWAWNQSETEKDLCGVYKCQALLTLPLVKLETNLLKAALRYWDTKTHTFRFGDKEICPTPEEFGAIAGFLYNDNPAVSSLPGGYSGDFIEMFDMPNVNRNLVRDNFASIEILVDHYSPIIEPGEKHRSPECRRFALCLSLVHHFLFFSKSGMFWSGLIRVMKQIKDNKSPMVMSLAETIMSLDKAKHMDIPIFEGAVIVLQIWLLERLGKIGLPQDRVPYRAADFHNRPKLYERMNKTSWAELFVNPKIKWVVPEWKIRRMRYVDTHRNFVSIMGIWEVTHILPERFMRQYGMKQIIPNRDPAELELPCPYRRVSQHQLDNWPRIYSSHPIVRVPTHLDDETLAPFCEKWMRATTQVDRDNARMESMKANKIHTSEPSQVRPENRMNVQNGRRASYEQETSKEHVDRKGKKKKVTL